MSSSPNKDFLGDYVSTEFDTTKLVLKLKESTSSNPKAPVLKGFIVVTPTKLRKMLDTMSTSNSQVAYVDVALWPARDAQYKFEGSASLRESFDAVPENLEEKLEASRSKVPEDIYRV